MREIKPTQRGIGFIQVILLLALITAAAVGYRVYESNKRKTEIALQELLKKQQAAAEVARLEAQQREESARAAELARQTAEHRAKITSILNKWDDAIKLAGMTSRIALAQPLSQMQSVRRELDELRINSCFDGATRKVVSGMNDAIFAFEMFVRFPNNTVASVSTEQSLSSSGEKISAGKQAISRCE